MNYFEFIKYNNRSIEELREYFQVNFSKYYDLWYDGYWKSKFTGVGMAVALYLTGYIHTKKPKHIVEYGSGVTTLIMSTILKDLNYGGSVISFEDNKKYYNLGKDSGFYINSDVHLVYVKINDNQTCYYNHDMNLIKDVDFVLDDGPDIAKYNCNASTNMVKLKEHFNTNFSFLIDGRIQQQRYYKSLFGDKVESSWIGIDKTKEFKREHGYKCGIGTI